VFSQLPSTYSGISIAPPAPSCGYTRIKDYPLIKPLIDADYIVVRAIRVPSIYKKVLNGQPGIRTLSIKEGSRASIYIPDR